MTADVFLLTSNLFLQTADVLLLTAELFLLTEDVLPHPAKELMLTAFDVEAGYYIAAMLVTVDVSLLETSHIAASKCTAADSCKYRR